MSKNEYLERLRNQLQNIPNDEVNNIVEYYREYFEDAGVENEENVMKELGSPESLAARISNDYTGKEAGNGSAEFYNYTDGRNASSNQYSQAKPYQNKRNGEKNVVLWAIIAVLTFPLWFSVGVTALALLFAFAVAIASIIFACVVSAAALACGGIFSIVMGFPLLLTSAPNAVAAFGCGFLFLGVSALLFAAFLGMFQGCRKAISYISRRKRGRMNEKNN